MWLISWHMPSCERRNCSISLEFFCSKCKMFTLVHLKGSIFFMVNHNCSVYYTEQIGHIILTIKNLSNSNKKLRGAGKWLVTHFQNCFRWKTGFSRTKIHKKSLLQSDLLVRKQSLISVQIFCCSLARVIVRLFVFSFFVCNSPPSTELWSHRCNLLFC